VSPLPRSPLLQKLSNLGQEVGEALLSEHFGCSSVPADPNLFVLLLNVFNFAAKADSLNWDYRPCFLMPQLTWIFLIRTMPLCITKIKLNNLLLDADALLQALAFSGNAGNLRKLKIKQSELTEEGLQHLQAMPRLRTLDISLCAVPAALQIICRISRKLKVLYYGWIQAYSSGAMAASSLNLACVSSAFKFQMTNLKTSKNLSNQRHRVSQREYW
jgi:hypothetical protein